jgi:peptidoglycan hydrolase-like protein with peptidoglycan-binding domain
MDSRVLAAQLWVNATYGDVDGYEPCPVDGKTGWLTMYSLTMALQHELGIASLSANFGPTTLSWLTTRGGIPFTEQNTNLIRILQHGCFCKGYDPGEPNGVFQQATKNAIGALMSDAGVGSLASAVKPKVVKALLTMDAYVVVMNGTAAVRGIQQWLNGKYWGRRDFYIIPCDGNFSRDVQKAMLIAIQFELGMTDDQATGAFGPGTQAGLRAHEVAVGSTGVWVQLFSASMVFNHYGASTSTFSATLESAVRQFQGFSMLTQNGRGDFATWAQLLVSTGDPSRPGTAADCITTITPQRAQALYAAGYRMIGRYLDERGGTLNKEIQPGELPVIFAAGMRVFPISQYYGGDAEYFTHDQGHKDAVDAHAAAYQRGFRTGTVIYFAVDFDATQADIDSSVIEYFEGVREGLYSQGNKYLHGVYGSRNVCTEVSTRTGARWSFVSGMSTGFSGNMGYSLPTNWAFNQIQTLTVASGAGLIEIDKNVHRDNTDAAVSALDSPADTISRFVADVQNIYNLAGDYAPNGDHNSLVLQYLRHSVYDGTNWDIMAGAIDDSFIAYVQDTAFRVETTFLDPRWKILIGTAHLGATCHGYVHQGIPASGVNLGDIAGWGGDLCTFYAEWRVDGEPSGSTYCQQHMALPAGGNTFSLDDLIADASAYTIATAVAGGKNIATAIREYFQPTDSYRTRLSRFRQARFGGTQAGANDMAREMLLSDDPAVSFARGYLIGITARPHSVELPGDLPPEDLDDFCMGFAATLVTRMIEEGQ